MKKNIAMRLASLVLMCTIVTSCFVGSTFAKYTSKASGSDSVTVAKWEFKVNGSDIAILGDDDTIDFDLFSTIYDTNGTDVEDDTNAKLAPGTSGAFDMSVQNTSDVTVEYSIEYETIAPDLTDPEGNELSIPLQFSVDGGATWSTELSDASEELDVGDPVQEIEVMWKWAYSNDDEKDTEIGKAVTKYMTTNNKDYVVKISTTITATQVD